MILPRRIHGPDLLYRHLVTTCMSLLLYARLNQGKGTGIQQFAQDAPYPDASNPACRNFTVGNPERQEFFTPNFSPTSEQKYPNNTDCVKVIEADHGFLLRLDFRDKFDVEPSEGCKYDYLEIRDGAHGYSPLIAVFCGQVFPHIVTSSDRYLWLRFHTDDSAEYYGFKAVYEFVPRPTSVIQGPPMNMCQIEVSGFEGFVNNTDIEQSRVRYTLTYGVPLDCVWIIKVKEGFKIQMYFIKFKLIEPNECDINFVDIFSDKTDLPNRLKNFCGSVADSVTSKTNVLHLRFYAERRAINSSFEALYTAFRDKEGGLCTPEEYDCEDATCIDKSLRCNGRRNCRFRWDEDGCNVKKGSLLNMNSEHIIIIMVIGCLIMFGMCFAMLFNCVRKLMRDHRIMQDHVRQSREGRLHEVGREISLDASPQPVRRSKFMSEPPEDPGCYVPGGDLPVLMAKRSNGDAVFLKENEAGVEVRDNECQTRDSLIQQNHNGSGRESDRSCTPPPPPPPAAARFNRQSGKPNNAFSTFGGRGLNRDLGPALNQPLDPPHRFRAEAVIEMQQQKQQQQQQQQQQLGRPYSLESTKSAPDVIVTH